MNVPPDDDVTELDRLIEGHLDGTLDNHNQRRLGGLVAESAAVAGRLARATLVHDRLIDLLRDEPGKEPGNVEASRWGALQPRSRFLRLALPLGLAAVLAVGSLLLLRPAPANASASPSAALESLVLASAAATDRPAASWGTTPSRRKPLTPFKLPSARLPVQPLAKPNST
jgi:hypothetical protein